MRFHKDLFVRASWLLQDGDHFFFIYMGWGREYWRVIFEYSSLLKKFLCLIPNKNLSCKGDIIFTPRNSKEN